VDVQDFSCMAEKPDTSRDVFNKLHYKRDIRHLTEMKICIVVLWITGLHRLLGDYQSFEEPNGYVFCTKGVCSTC